MLIEESHTTKRLSLWVVIFAVSTARGPNCGMHFEYTPELEWAWRGATR